MPTSIFISYSRTEAPFVDQLLDQLEDQQLEVWLDYHRLAPGKSWEEQIEEAITAADVFLLVVSPAAIASPNVREEWRMALERKGQRVILALFETTALPPEFEKREWVDFRASFRKGVTRLIELLGQPAGSVQSPVPTRGFKAPRTVWWAALCSIGVAILSLGAIWTLYLPYHLLALPVRIFRRNYDYFHVQSALVMLPLTLLLTSLILGDTEFNWVALWAESFLLISLFLVPILFILLRSRALQRWGMPMASRPRFANLFRPEKLRVEPTPFHVEYAPEDKRYARKLIRSLESSGHPYRARPEEARARFVLISRYKNRCDYREPGLLFPVILQESPELEERLQRIQWIDFRRGLRRLDAMGLLLHQPDRLLKALGINPSGKQTVLPAVIRALVFYFTLLGILTLGGMLVFFLDHAEDFTGGLPLGILLFKLLLLVAFLALNFYLVKALITRQGKLLHPAAFLMSLFFMGILIFFLLLSGINLQDAFALQDTQRSIADLVYPLTYLLGLALLIPLCIWFRHDLARWFPALDKARLQRPDNIWQRVFLGYWPGNRKAWWLHGGFYFVVVSAVAVLMFTIWEVEVGQAPGTILREAMYWVGGLLALAGLFHWRARRQEKILT